MRDLIEEKKCSRCGVVKPVSDFYIRSDSKKYLGRCKTCVKSYNTQYFDKNKDSLKEDHKNYGIENKDSISLNKKRYYVCKKSEILQEKKNYYKNNKSKIRTRIREYESTRRKTDKVYALRKNISTNIGKHLAKAGESCMKYLPYTIAQLKQHLESQFELWMTWKNYGKYDPKIWNDNDPTTWTWQLDHIIPHSTFKYASMKDEEFKKCWALDNLRPYSAKQNYLDGITRTRHIK